MQLNQTGKQVDTGCFFQYIFSLKLRKEIVRMAVFKPENAKTIVRFEHIEKSFDGETLVIKDLNLDIFEGEFLTLLGPSGSGKTTTLMMLAGFETPIHQQHSAT
jgi:ABC-type bacteriocin/lantibiotic exporter with double-glycine peptidase domain